MLILSMYDEIFEDMMKFMQYGYVLMILMFMNNFLKIYSDYVR
jgi:hypothetical protein